jgi:2-phospho-L-lactate/phosphoenolpyruvate guanylyltransferase
VVPAKRLPAAKTRLRPVTADLPEPAAAHADLVLALLADTVAAALACADVGTVLVVTDDPAAGSLVRRLGARTVADAPGQGLNPALAHGAAGLQGAVAALSSDLPALRPAELGTALAAAGSSPRTFVADGDGSGTTLLTALGVPLDPRFGPGSAAAHAASGALPLPGDLPGLRRDVDTAADLAAAAGLGVGRHTAAVLARLAAAAPRPAAAC